MKARTFTQSLLAAMVLAISIPAGAQSYCVPTVNSTGNFGIGISNVSMGNISNNTGAPVSSITYIDYSSTHFTAASPGATVNFSLTAGNGNTTTFGIYIDWDNDKTFSTGEQVALSGSTSASTVWSSSFQVPGGQQPGSYRMRIVGDLGGQANNPCVIGWSGEAEDYSFVVLSNTLDVAAISGTNVLSIGNNTLDLTFANFTSGTTVTSVDIGYSVNNGTPVTQSLSVNMGPGTLLNRTYSQVLNISTPGMYTLKMWCRNPNGQGNINSGNDTVTYVLQACYPLNGTYTIDPNGSGGSNYTSFTAAISDLQNCGVNGPVTFNVAAATFTEQISVPFVPGISQTNTITFIGAGKSSTLLTYANQTAGNQHTLKLDGANYVEFRDMTIRSTNGTYGWTVHFTGVGGVAYNRLANVNIECAGGGTNATGTNFIPLVFTGSNTSYSTNVLAYENRIDSCLIDGGYIGISFYGNTTSNANYGNYFTFNEIRNAYYYGVYGIYLSEIKFFNNLITPRTSGSTTTASYGMYFANGTNSYPYLHEIRNNRIYNCGTYGIYLASVSGSVGSRGVMANNMIGGNFTSTSNIYGVYVSYAYWWNIYNNSININTNASADAIGFYTQNSANQFNLDVRNNMIQVTGTAGNPLALYGVAGTAFSDLDYNNYVVTNGANLLFLGQMLGAATFKGAQGLNQNSFNVASPYQSATDLRYTNGCVTGFPLSQVSTDIDGDTRTNTPNVGADEFINASTNDIGILSIVSPSGQVSPGLQNLVVRLKNFGTNTITSAQVSYVLNGGNPVTVSWSGTLLPCGEVDITFSGTNGITLVSGVNNVAVYSSSPNGTADNFPGNDQSEGKFCPAMSGNFTIDANGSGASNFKSFTEAIDALSCSGLNGPVHFTVAPGTYGEQITIRNIGGLSSTNTLTFDGGAGNMRNTILTFGNAQNTARHTLLLEDMKYVTIRNMSIIGQSQSYGWPLHIMGNNTDNIRISNCYIGLSGTGASSTSTNFIPVVVSNSTTSYSTSFQFKNVVIDSSEVYGGYFGVVMYGNGSTASGNELTNTRINNVYYYGTYLVNLNAMDVSGNQVDMRLGNANSYGIYLSSVFAQGNTKTRINTNRVINAGRYGIYLTSVTNLAGNPGEMYNNMVGGGFTSTSTQGIYLSSSNYWNIQHNSVNVDFQVSSTTATALYTTSSNYLDIRNNIFALTHPNINSGSIYPVYMNNASTSLVCDYNTYFKNGNTNNFVRINGAIYNAGNFKGGGGFNTNSYFVKPEFVTATDLHAINGCMIAPVLTSVSTDYDGDSRQSMTTVGADEGAQVDAAISDLIAPAGTVITGTQDVVFNVTNTGKTTITGFTASYMVNGTNRVDQNWAGTLNPCDQVQITFTGGQAAVIPNSGSVTLSAFISNVNGNNDDNQNNDSTAGAYCNGPLSGTYTVIPGSSADRNFPSLQSVMNALNSCGMGGDVTFQVGAGKFVNQMYLNPNTISGLASYKLTFEGIDSAQSVMTFNGGGYTLRLDGADNVTFRRMGIENTGTASAFTVHLTNGADNNVFENCWMYSPSVSNTTVITFGIMGSAYQTTGNYWGSGNLVQNSYLYGGYRTVNMYGSGNTSLFAVSNRILNNTIVDGYNYTTYCYFQQEPEFSGNYVSAPSSATGVMYFSYCPTIKVQRNYLYGGSTYGLYLSQSNPSTAYPQGIVSNNMSGGQYTTGTSYAFYNTSVSNMDFYHNTGFVSSQNISGRAFFHSSGSGNNLVNNVFSCEGSSGYAMYLNTNGTYLRVDYNNLYTVSTTLAYTWGTNFFDMASLQASNANMNENSVSEKPLFVNTNTINPNLHLTHGQASPSGDNTLGIMVDIDNDARCAVAKTMGADESEYVDEIDIRFTAPDTVYVNSPFTAINGDLPGLLRGYEWDFGNDGSVEATTFNASFAFNSPGTRQIKLKASTCNSADSMIRTVVVVAPTQVPQADFIADKYVVAPFETVVLQDLSTNGPVSWVWSITPDPNSLIFYDPFAQNPEVFFGEPGVYEVCLEATNGLGTSAQKCKTAYITVKDVNNMCIGNLSSSAVSGEIYDSGGPTGNYGNSENCTFLIEPCASSINLKFSQFSTANAAHFLRVYDGRDATGTLLGVFSSTSGLPGGTNGLTATSGAMFLSWSTNLTGSASGFAATWTSVPNSNVQLTAGFDAPDSSYVLETVDFLNTSVGNGMSFSWDVDGDGMEDATSEDVQFIYTIDGVYYPKLTVNDACGNMSSVTDTIVVTTPTVPPVADFIADARVVTITDTVRFTDLSTNGPISWNYTFTPNTVSIFGNSRNPVVVFQDTGWYEVSLDADNAAGTGSITKTQYIHVVEYCIADVSTLVPDLGINRVVLNNMENTSASGVQAFTSYFNDPTVEPAQLDAGGTYTLTVARNTTLNQMSRKVWIDYNGDGDFDDANELVGQETAANTASWSHSLTIPTSANRGATRMRIGTAFGDSTNNPCGENFFGEVEEYRIVINDDITPPVITLVGGSPQYVELGQNYADSGATAFDAVDGNVTSLLVSSTTLNVNVAGTYYFCYNVTDAAGNSAEEVCRTVIVLPDITPPVLQLNSPTVITVPLLATFTEPGFTANDVISGNVTASVQVDRSAFDSTRVGSYLIRYVAFDTYGNSDTAWRTVNVVDLIAPMITLNGSSPMDIEVFTPFNDPGVSVSDNYDQMVVAKITSNVNNQVLGSYTIQYVATDSSGNSSFITREVNVVDQTAPVLTLSNTDTIVMEVFGQLVLPGRTATDNYDPNPAINVSGNYSTTVLGTYQIDFQAEDASGNQSPVQSVVLVVVDTKAPVITLNGNYLITVMRWTSFNDPGVSISDNYYSGLTATVGGNFVSTSEEGLYYITYDVTDPSGNVAAQVIRAVNVIGNTTGVDEADAPDLKLYPNPSNGVVQIELVNFSGNATSFRVINNLGQVVYVQNWNPGATQEQFDVSNLAPGVYHVQVMSESGTLLKKLVVTQ